MRLDQVIKYYRKKEKLTQEQVANYLNISAPAVNKWESRMSYPDITLLVPLARLLKIDVNTLLDFNQELSTEQVDSFVDEVIHLSENSSYQVAFERGSEIINQYSGCDELMFWITTTLRIELLISKTIDKDRYERKIIQWLELVASRNKGKISSMAKLDLASIYKVKKEYEHAQNILDTIQGLEASKTFQQAALFNSQGKHEEAHKVCEDYLLNNVNDTLNVLIVLISMLGEEKKFDEAEHYLERAKKHIQTFDLGVYHEHSLELMLAKIEKDKERAIKCIINMFNDAKSINSITKSRLFRHKYNKNDDSNNILKDRNMLLETIIKDHDLDFVKNDSRIKKILKQYASK